MDDMLNDDSHLTCSKTDLVRKIQCILDHVKLFKITAFIEEVYDSYLENPYHNIRHAFEVLQMTHIIAQLCKLQKDFPVDELQLLYIVALCHDIQHKGHTNDELSKLPTNNVVSYDIIHDVTSYTSINENTHIKETMCLLEKYKMIWLDNSTHNKVKSLILGTDLKLHNYYVVTTKEKRVIYLNMILKLADMSHFFRQFKIHYYWVNMVQKEHNINLDLYELCNDTLWFRKTFVEDVFNILCAKYHNMEVLRDFYRDNILRWMDIKSNVPIN